MTVDSWDLPLGYLFGHEGRDQANSSGPVDEFAQSVVGIGDVQDNVGDVAEHSQEALEKKRYISHSDHSTN